MSALRSTTLLAVVASLMLAPSGARALTARQIYETTSPSVVVVVATNTSDPTNAGIGSGSIVAADGLILTNFHVVRMGDDVADTIRVFFKPAKLSGSLNKDLQDGVRATLVATDPGRDLALLSVAPRLVEAPPIPITDQLAQPGDPSVAIGSPVDGGPWTLTTGAISNRILDLEGKQGKHAYQIETPINPGNSGGALLDGDAALLGVTTSAVKIGKGGLPTANIQFAVANDVVLDFIQAALVSRQEFRELSAKEQASVASRFARRAASGAGSVVEGCAYGVCRVTGETALDRIWARMTRLAGAAGAQRYRLMSRGLSERKTAAAAPPARAAVGAAPAEATPVVADPAATAAVTAVSEPSQRAIPSTPAQPREVRRLGNAYTEPEGSLTVEDGEGLVTDPDGEAVETGVRGVTGIPVETGVRGVRGLPVETSGRGSKAPPALAEGSDEGALPAAAADGAEPPAPPSPTLDAARVTVARLFGGQRPAVPAATSADPAWTRFEHEQFDGLGDGGSAGSADALTMPPSAAELEALLPAGEAAASDAAAEPLPEVTNGAAAWLSGGAPEGGDRPGRGRSAVRAARFAAVRWATRPLFARATAGCAGTAAAGCVAALAATRPERLASDTHAETATVIAAAPEPAGPAPARRPAPRPRLRQAITLDDYATSTRPIRQEQLSAVGKQLAADKFARAGEVRDAVIGKLFRGEFRDALALVKKAPELRTLEAAAAKFVRAERELAQRRFNGARTALRSVRQPEDMRRLADYWICRTMRLQGRPIGAEQCFKKGGMTEGILP